MIDPSILITKAFEPVNIIFIKDNFVIAEGKEMNGNRILAMRWMSENPELNGFPSSFGHPVWFLVHIDLKDAIIGALISSSAIGLDIRSITKSLI